MSNEKFNSLLEEFKKNFKLVSDSNDLQDLKEKYISLEISRENVFDWIISNIQEDEQKGEYFNRFGKFENSLWQTDNSQELIVGIPIFDLDISFDEIDQMFDDYGSYFQRYGCMSSEQIISWDRENVLFDDEFGNVEIVKRPDILLNVQ
jgi:hypothetical protein